MALHGSLVPHVPPVGRQTLRAAPRAIFHQILCRDLAQGSLQVLCGLGGILSFQELAGLGGEVGAPPPAPKRTLYSLDRTASPQILRRFSAENCGWIPHLVLGRSGLYLVGSHGPSCSPSGLPLPAAPLEALHGSPVAHVQPVVRQILGPAPHTIFHQILCRDSPQDSLQLLCGLRGILSFLELAGSGGEVRAPPPAPKTTLYSLDRTGSPQILRRFSAENCRWLPSRG